MVVNVHQAKTHLSRLLQKVAQGEEITIANAGVPVARLVPAGKPLARRKLGEYEGKVWIADDFDAPCPEVEALFEGQPRTARQRQTTVKNRPR
ncbi:MAG TPA: type II toxin-antitoxin system Phd/YefM family antitoxin [Terriglobales bacterium]|jgi:prevent-host-death family protein